MILDFRQKKSLKTQLIQHECFCHYSVNTISLLTRYSFFHIRYSLKRVPMVLVASLYELSRPSSPSGLLHGSNQLASATFEDGGHRPEVAGYSCFTIAVYLG